MSDYLEWREDWLLHIDDMDREHLELVRLFNALARRLCDCKSSPVGKTPEDEHFVVALINRIGQQTKDHFGKEEDMMLAMGYPDFESHRYEHVTLLAEYAELMRDLRERGLTCLDQTTLDALKGWLISHIAGADSRFGEFYHEAREGVSQSDQDVFNTRWVSRARNMP